MTLGAWFKDFVMYPLLKTDGFQRLGDWGKRHFWKKTGEENSYSGRFADCLVSAGDCGGMEENGPLSLALVFTMPF